MFVILNEDNILIKINTLPGYHCYNELNFICKNSIYEKMLNIPIFGSESVANEIIDYIKNNIKIKTNFNLNKIIFDEDDNIDENQHCYIVLNNARDSVLNTTYYNTDYIFNTTNFTNIKRFIRSNFTINTIFLPAIPKVTHTLSKGTYYQKVYLVEYQ